LPITNYLVTLKNLASEFPSTYVEELRSLRESETMDWFTIKNHELENQASSSPSLLSHSKETTDDNHVPIPEEENSALSSRTLASQSITGPVEDKDEGEVDTGGGVERGEGEVIDEEGMNGGNNASGGLKRGEGEVIPQEENNSGGGAERGEGEVIDEKGMNGGHQQKVENQI
jgi:hypothetical protein